MATSTPERYDAFSISLHWVVAFAVVAAFALGPDDFGRLAKNGIDPGTRIDIVAHESIGLLVWLLTLVRLLWIAVRPRAPSAAGPGWLHKAALAVRWMLWGLLLATPVAALLTLAGENHPLTLLAGVRLETIPLLQGSAFARMVDWGEVHGFLGDTVAWIAGIHAVAALVHHFVLRDNVLKSMLPRRRP